MILPSLRVAACLLLLTAGCGSVPAPAVEVGTRFADAVAVLERGGARPVELAVLPATRRDGTALGMQCFEMGDTALLVVYDPALDGEIIVLQVCEEMQKRKVDRDWRPVDRYVLTAR